MIKYYDNPFDLPSIFNNNIINNSSYYSYPKSKIANFLIINGLEQYIELFEKEEVTYDILKLCTKEDLKMIGIPLGHSLLIKHLLENF